MAYPRFFLREYPLFYRQNGINVPMVLFLKTNWFKTIYNYYTISTVIYKYPFIPFLYYMILFTIFLHHMQLFCLSLASIHCFVIKKDPWHYHKSFHYHIFNYTFYTLLFSRIKVSLLSSFDYLVAQDIW